ncbi:MAG: hypothetical protein AAFZ01_03095 [Pseudomonadota bacterium]
MSVDHAEIASLSLKGSELAKLDGRGTKIFGPLSLKQATVRDGVNLDQVSISSSFDLEGAQVHPRLGDDNARAITCQNAGIDGDVYFGTGSRIFAYADFFGSRIGGILALYECVFRADDGGAGEQKSAGLLANSSVINGGFGTIRSKIQSGIYITSSRLSRLGLFESTRVNSSNGSAVSFENTRIESDLAIKDNCLFEGVFNLAGANILGDFGVSKSVFNSQNDGCTQVAVNLLGAEVHGSFYFVNQTRVNGGTRLINLEVGKDFVIENTTLHNRSFSQMGLAIDGQDMTVNSIFRFGPNNVVIGDTAFRNVKTGSQFIVSSSRMTSRFQGEARNVFLCEMVDVGSILSIAGQCEFDGIVSFSGGKVGSELQINGSRFLGAESQTGPIALRCVGMLIQSSVYISDRCDFRGFVDFSSSEVRENFGISDCKFRNRNEMMSSVALSLYNAHIGRDLNIVSDVGIEGGFVASGLRVDGSLFFSHLKINNGEEGLDTVALRMAGVKVGGNATLTPGFVARGGVDLSGARIERQLSLSGASVVNASSDGSANSLFGEGMHVGGHLFLSSGFDAHGRVDLRGANFGSDVVLIGATISNLYEFPREKGSQSRRTSQNALTLAGARIGNFLWLGPAIPPNDQHVTINGSLDLSNAYAHILIDDPKSWPGGEHSKTVFDAQGKALRLNLGLDGFTYGSFGRAKMANWKLRRLWLERQGDDARFNDFRPQPYEQLATVLRSMGHARDAREIAKLRQSAERKATVRREWGKRSGQAIAAQLERFFYGALAGYGYAFKRLLVMVALLWGLGAVVYSAAEEQGLIAPADAVVFTNPDLQQSCSVSWTRCKDLPREHSAFDARIYALDVMVPIVSLGMEDDWSVVDLHDVEMVGRSPQQRFELTFGRNTWTTPSWFLRAIYWTQVILGWVLSGLLLAVLSGFMKQD